MTKQETIKIIAMLKVAYPKFFVSADETEIQLQIDVWHGMFADDPFKLVEEAVKALMCTLVFPPTIADIKEKVALILQPPALSEMEAWQIVREAVEDYDYYDTANNRKIFDSLPPMFKRLVGNISQLREWQEMDRSTFNSVEQSNFMRSYTALVRHEREQQLLPGSTKALMKEIEAARQKQLKGEGG